jgi:UDP-N-acetylglucosamine--N-acetylmuramyl-(pentapeptide) pyrophosphoryl-undecaprenol N-acetylglucosamine transferase
MKRYAITGGGTGGHLTIARALKKEIVARGDEVVFIGSANGQDPFWFKNEEGCKEKIFLNSSGVTGKGNLKGLKSMANLVKLAIGLNPLFNKYNFDAVISVGGYSSAPASILAILRRIPLFVHEQNAEIGKFNKLLKPFAKEFFSSYLVESPVKDYPIADIFFKGRRIRKNISKVIFLGGSQGARFINDFAIKVAPHLKELQIDIIHQTGKADYERIRNAYREIGIEVELIDFHPELSRFISIADLAIGRSGASTLWELSANGLPAFFIPYPLANNHQWHNAKFISDLNLGWVYPQSEVQPDNLYAILGENLESKSRELMQMISPNGVKKIIDHIERNL